MFGTQIRKSLKEGEEPVKKQTLRDLKRPDVEDLIKSAIKAEKEETKRKEREERYRCCGCGC